MKLKLLLFPLLLSAANLAFASAQDQYQALIPVLTEHKATLEPLIHKAKVDIRSLYGVMDSSDPNEISAATQKLAGSVDTVNQEIYPVARLMDQINKEHPDLRAVHNQGEAGREASFLIGHLNDVIGKWDESRVDQATHYLQESESSLSQVEMMMGTMKSVPANVRGPMVSQQLGPLKSSRALLGVIPTLLPEPPVGMGKRTATMEQLVQRSTQLEAKYGQIETQMGQLSASAAKELQQQLEANRFPKDLKRDGDLETLLTDVYKKQHGDLKIERIGIKYDWRKKTEARWVSNTLVKETFNYVGAWIAHKTESGKFYAYSISFRKPLNQDGSWGALEQWGVGHAYEILEKNLQI